MTQYVLSPRQLSSFRQFGFLKLEGFFDAGTVASLEAEVRAQLASAYDLPTEIPDVVTGSMGYYLPLMGEGSATSRRLVAGPRLVGLGEALLDGPVMPKPAKGMLYNDASPWHRDAAAPALRAVKMVTYFSALTADSGALRVIPGSHRGEFSDRLTDYRAAWPLDSPLDEAGEADWWPGTSLDCRPGDLIVFDVRLWHASLFGRLRAQWSVSYVAVPETEAERRAAHDYIDLFLRAGHEYDAERFPYYDPDWSKTDGPAFAEAMADLGLIRVDGAAAAD
ncbi:phytanoyl-CoA dioxygenase family protein [Kitasatospora sp. NPDC056138]|uniref:phytanoyl-CoA dioxygenase family protein n=1 Tax=Kitasatospora sp. NPDC056138 TaxID=3345724 RepID=UPI0035D66A66